jgi:hypothetical protein
LNLDEFISEIVEVWPFLKYGIKHEKLTRISHFNMRVSKIRKLFLFIEKLTKDWYWMDGKLLTLITTRSQKSWSCGMGSKVPTPGNWPFGLSPSSSSWLANLGRDLNIKCIAYNFSIISYTVYYRYFCLHWNYYDVCGYIGVSSKNIYYFIYLHLFEEGKHFVLSWLNI